jgi:hypothetical protein
LVNAVALANFSLLQLHRQTRRKGINTCQIIASLEVGLGVGYYKIIGMGAQVCLMVSFLEARESPSHYFCSETARPQIGLWQKIRVNPNYLVVFLLLSPLFGSMGAYPSR